MALWFPDWPVQAVWLDREEKLQVKNPIAITAQYRIQVCGLVARRRGVKRGMKVRQAQAVCPELEVVDADLDRDARMFEGIIESLGDVASSVEVLRPGLVVIDAGAAARYHGSEDTAVAMLIDASSRQGIDVFAGVADEITTAVIAARYEGGKVVERGREASISFLNQQPLSALGAETALGCDLDVVRALSDLGLRTLGDLAALPVDAVATRFGNPGLRCHNIARARNARNVAPPITHVDWEVAHVPEETIMRVDAAAFLARTLAAQLHQRLAHAGVVCQVLKVTADFTTGDTLSRVWRTGEPLTEQATADRVRWQLDGWLTARGVTESDDPNDHDGITGLWLTPVECVPPDMASGGLWDTGRSHNHVARQVIQRVQSTLGIDAVLQPVPAGGRGVEERIHFVPYGEKRDAVRNPQGAWPGQIPGPLPARLGGGINHPASQITMIDAESQRIYVTAEALLSSSPYALAWGKARYLITGWAGPWPVDDRWWEKNGTKYARLQVVGRAVSEERQLSAWLLIWKDSKWRIEATY
ncbi:Y-family DNA polymerase [Corynebacterium deserti]|nr:DNA polymerase Y family protein [Corynebacterium deserti]